MSEAKTLRKEIVRIASDYDIEWKGELENLSSLHSSRQSPGTRATSPSDANGSKKGQKIDIDKTIDEADELAQQTEEQREKEQRAQRKGEFVDHTAGGSKGKKKSSVEKGEEKAKKVVEMR